VLARYRAIPGWPGQGLVLARLWGLAEALTPVERPGDYNQAMMDLGATVCTRANPDCASCPLVADCRAHAAGQATAYPQPKPRQVLPSRAAWFLILHNPQGEVLLERRPTDRYLGRALEPARVPYHRESPGLVPRPSECRGGTG
jgi:A/G-specific adenine glycosylase